MNQLQLVAPGQLQWTDVARPAAEQGDALVRPTAVALCDGDRSAIRGETIFPLPYAFGHEFVGELIHADPSVNVEVGSRVAVPFQISCGACPACVGGRTGNCQRHPRLSMYGFSAVGGAWGGAFADVVRVPHAQHMLVPLPADIDDAAAANAGDNLADAWRCVVPYVSSHQEVLVVATGGPSIGLWAAELAVLFGARRVRYMDTDETALALAEASGAEPLLGPIPRRLPEHDLTINASGTAHGLATCLRSTSPDGTCVSPSLYFDDVQVPILEMYSKNVTLVTGRPHSRALIDQTLAAIAAGRIDPLRIAEVVAWADLLSHVDSRAHKIVAVRD